MFVLKRSQFLRQFFIQRQKCIGSAYSSCHLSQHPTLILDTNVQHSYFGAAMHCRKWKETAAYFLKRLISQRSHFLLLVQVDKSLLHQQCSYCSPYEKQITNSTVTRVLYWLRTLAINICDLCWHNQVKSGIFNFPFIGVLNAPVLPPSNEVCLKILA